MLTQTCRRTWWRIWELLWNKAPLLFRAVSFGVHSPSLPGVKVNYCSTPFVPQKGYVGSRPFRLKLSEQCETPKCKGETVLFVQMEITVCCLLVPNGKLMECVGSFGCVFLSCCVSTPNFGSGQVQRP